MIKKIILAVVVLFVAVLIYAATQPDTFSVQRALLVKAPPEKIFPLINDFHNWSAWSPWEKLDLAMKKTHGGAASGKGAVYGWEGNNKVGQGSMEITESTAPASVIIKLDFIKPYEGHNIAEFTLQTQCDATNVQWLMHGSSPYMTKLMGLFFNMDSMIGKDFEAGLANLKRLAEK